MQTKVTIISGPSEAPPEGRQSGTATIATMDPMSAVISAVFASNIPKSSGKVAKHAQGVPPTRTGSGRRRGYPSGPGAPNPWTEVWAAWADAQASLARAAGTHSGVACPREWTCS